MTEGGIIQVKLRNLESKKLTIKGVAKSSNKRVGTDHPPLVWKSKKSDKSRRGVLEKVNMKNTWFLLILLMPIGCTNLRDTHERLHSVLWIQTSAEYKVLAQQQYGAAQDALDKALDSMDTSWSAAVEQVNTYANLPPAVILDLDETVLDNTPFEARLIQERRPFDREQFKGWIAKAEARAVPGAVEFIKHARERGVTVFFITNRYGDEEPDTRRNLQRLSITLPEAVDTVLSSRELPYNWPSDKKDRRHFVAQKYRILLLIGDDLTDFVSASRNEVSERRKIAEQYTDKWGKVWFLIPNPIYGTWELALYPNGLRDDEILAKKREHLKSY
jgi:5'-nucleotidase (lipoprotein e(P4) family)